MITAISAAAGVQAQFHPRPYERWDPWVGLGFGWRGYWADVGDGTYGLQGFDLVRLRVGVAYRLSARFAVGPVIGATVTDFLSREPAGATGYQSGDDKKLSTFVFAGFNGRFSL